MKFLLFLVAALVCTVFAASNGYNDRINWINDLSVAKQTAAAEGKPILTMIVKSWCGACKRVQAQFQETTDEKLFELSKKFVMVNLLDDQEPKDAVYAPDGGYIPRIVFSDKAGVVQAQLSNKNRPDSYKYFYNDVPSVIKSMESALEILK